MSFGKRFEDEISKILNLFTNAYKAKGKHFKWHKNLGDTHNVDMPDFLVESRNAITWIECKSYQNKFNHKAWEKTAQGKYCIDMPYKGFLLLEDLSKPKVSYKIYHYLYKTPEGDRTKKYEVIELKKLNKFAKLLEGTLVY